MDVITTAPSRFDRCRSDDETGHLMNSCHNFRVNRIIDPASMAAPAARYAHAVLSIDSRRLLHTSGVVPIGADGNVPSTLADQADIVWGNLLAILEDAQMTVVDIVSVTTYVVHGEDLFTVMAARDRVFGDHRAASTLVTVPALARPEWKMEVAVIAAS